MKLSEDTRQHLRCFIGQVQAFWWRIWWKITMKMLCLPWKGFAFVWTCHTKYTPSRYSTTLPMMIILDHIHHVYSWVQRKRRPLASLTLMSRAWPISKLALVMCVALRIFLQTSEDLCKITQNTVSAIFGNYWFGKLKQRNGVATTV